MSVQAGYRYTNEHEWLKSESGTRARVGITHYAQHELGDVVFVDLPEVGKTVTKGSSFSTVESVKAVSDVYAPVDGKVVEVNTALADNPQAINQSPYADGWMIVLEVSDPKQIDSLFDSARYEAYLKEIAK